MQEENKQLQKIRKRPFLRQNNINMTSELSQNYDNYVQERFIELQFQISQIHDLTQEQRREKIKILVSKIIRTVMSVGFKQSEFDRFTDKKLRQFFCNNVIANIVKFAHRNKLSVNDLKFLDNYLQKNLLAFLKQRYPQNESNQANKKFQSMITPIDNFDSNKNDLVFQSGVKFHYKQSGDYSQQIMQFLNYLITITKKIPQQQQQKYKKEMIEYHQIRNLGQIFIQQMSDIFKKVEDSTWMIYAKKKDFTKGDNQEKNNQNILTHLIQNYQNKDKTKDIKDDSHQLQKQQHKQQYKKQVKQYTKYIIGQKLSDNVAQYSEDDIQNNNFKVSNSGLMRILTKWCEELRNNLQQENINSRDQRFRMQDGTERYLKKVQKQQLYLQIHEQQKKLQQFLKQIKQNIYQNQHIVLSDKRCVNAFNDFASQFQGIAGYFSSFMKKSNQNYLVSYLNKLIHCILTAQQNFKNKYPKKDHYKIAVNLISFKIGDLLRCKCTSKQSQIIAIYNYLVYQHKKQSNKNRFQIVRVKNRLSGGTRDILMNVRFKSILLVQIQLAIDEQSTKFIKLSDKTNHFIFQLERAIFGPISQLCNAYAAIDPRFQFLSAKFQSISDQKTRQLKTKNKSFFTSLGCQHLKNNIHQGKQITLPIWCINCHIFTASLNIFIKHRQCTICKQSVCSSCLARNQFIKNDDSQQNIHFQNFIKGPNQMIRKKIILVDLKNKIKKQQEIYISYFNFKIMLFQYQRDQNKLKFILQTKKKDQFNKYFTNKYIKLQLDATKEEKQKIQPLLYEEIAKQMIKSANKRQRQFFVLEQVQLDVNKIFKQKMPTVETINLKNISLQNVDKIVECFPNAKVLMLHKNKINSIQKIGMLTQLEELNLQGNKLKQVPQQIKELKKLQFLLLTNNKFQIFPQNVCNITNLRRLNFKQNLIIGLPPSIKGLKNLKNLRLTTNKIVSLPKQIKFLTDLIQLDAAKNCIKIFPQQIKYLTKLQLLNLSQNQIETIPQDTFQNLNQIQQISFKSNKKINKFPCFLQDKKKLKSINFQNNHIIQIPQFIFYLQNMQQIIFSKNYITQLKMSKQANRKSKLKVFKISKNQVRNLPQNICTFSALEILDLGGNKIEGLPKNMEKLKNIKQINLSNFKLTQFPKFLINLSKLQIINLDNNEISQLLPQFFNSQNIRFLENIIQFSMCNNKLKIFPKSLSKCNNIQTIKINNNEIQQFNLQSKQGNNKSKLKILELNNNKISELTKQIYGYTSLQTLNLGQNKIQNLDSQFKLLVNLKEINLSNFNFFEFPQQLFEMGKLQSINLDNNNIQSFPLQFFDEAKFKDKLKKLSLQNNYFTQFPSQLIKYKKLQKVNFLRNMIQKLPQQVQMFIKQKEEKVKNKLKQQKQLKIFYSYQLKELKIPLKNTVQKRKSQNIVQIKKTKDKTQQSKSTYLKFDSKSVDKLQQYFSKKSVEKIKIINVSINQVQKQISKLKKITLSDFNKLSITTQSLNKRFNYNIDRKNQYNSVNK